MRRRIDIIEIHPVLLTKAAIVESARLEFGEGKSNFDDILDLNDEEFADRFSDLYLIEVRIDNPDSQFDPGKFTQALPGFPRDSWQVAYDEKFLNDDGTEVIDRPPSSMGLRMGFFFHFVELEEPLTTPYGILRLPVPTRMPERLKQLFRYIPP
jgi:hypothetical protein